MNSEVIMAAVIGIVGGLGIFLLGMKNLSEGLQAIAGAGLRKMISLVTDNRILAVIVGLSVTVMVQSSSMSSLKLENTDFPSSVSRPLSISFQKTRSFASPV